MAKNSEQQQALFPVCYRIGGDKPGQPVFRVNFLVDPVAKTVSGEGHITQATNPELSIDTKLTGHYHEHRDIEGNTYIHITAIGIPLFPPQDIPVMPNVRLSMIVRENFKVPPGAAIYEYRENGDLWTAVVGASVESAPCWRTVEEANSNSNSNSNSIGICSKWELVEPLTKATITADFSGNRISGSAGCNIYNGNVTTALGCNQIDITVTSVTLKLCEESIMREEARYLALLDKVNVYSIDGDKLSFYINKTAALLVFKRVK